MVAKSWVKIIPSIEAKCKLVDSTVIDCKLEQPANARSPVDVTLVGMQYDENLCLTGKEKIVSRFFEKRIPSIEQKC